MSILPVAAVGANRHRPGRLRHPGFRRSMVSAAGGGSPSAAPRTVATVTRRAPPALANPESGSRAKEIGMRRGAVPYKDEPEECDILVNDRAAEAIKAAGADRFVNLIDPTNPKLVKLLTIMEDGWDRVGVRHKNAGHHSLWPEAFRAGRALLEEAFPDQCDPARGGEVLEGVAFVGDEHRDRAIDFMQRRPKADFTMSKYNPLPRLHRDPDAIDYKSPGWMETSMPGSKSSSEGGAGDEDGAYSYRYYNIWLARTPLDASGQVWENPLCLLLPRDGGAQEWDFEIRKPEDNDGAEEESIGDMVSRVAKNPISAAPIIMKAFSFKKISKEDQFAFTDPNYMARGSPELTPDGKHVWVTAPFAIFDSFDVWHGAAKWDGDMKGELCNGAKDVMRARQEAAKGRVSMELRFRARCRPEGQKGGSPGVPWSPLSAAYRGGAFTPTTVRPTGGKYDLQTGNVVVEE
mmetsp:Transcript_36422/g.90823  ORF Transcript_36422/g.90823 Transcript_36422/m.90823 type:complete len:462 (-) Transcript_36422:57-1442(-)